VIFDTLNLRESRLLLSFRDSIGVLTKAVVDILLVPLGIESKEDDRVSFKKDFALASATTSMSSLERCGTAFSEVETLKFDGRSIILNKSLKKKTH
jgi:hypothetical protein